MITNFCKNLGDILTYKDDYQYKLAVGFMIAQEYGFKRIMSSYDFHDWGQGPPGSPPNSFGTGQCGNGWICEHRWSSIMNMAKVFILYLRLEITIIDFLCSLPIGWLATSWRIGKSKKAL